MNPSLRRHQRDWEDLGDLDPCWAILAFPERRYGRWDLDELFRSGEQEIPGLAGDMQRLGYPARRERALDFGCGVGRLTRALATHFRHCYGLTSRRPAPMIAATRKLNATYPNCELVLNDNPDLRMFPDGHFDLIYICSSCSICPPGPPSAPMLRTLPGFSRRRTARVSDPEPYSAQTAASATAARLYGVLGLGVAPGVLYHRLGLVPMRMTSLAEPQGRALLTEAGGQVLEARANAMASTAIESRTYKLHPSSSSRLSSFSRSIW